MMTEERNLLVDVDAQRVVEVCFYSMKANLNSGWADLNSELPLERGKPERLV